MSAVDTQQVWQNALAEMRLRIRPEDFDPWFQDTRLLSCDAQACVVAVGNSMTRDWLTTKCSSLVGQTLHQLLGHPVTVAFVDPPREEVVGARPPLRLVAPPPQRNGKSTRKRATPDARPSVSARYTFDSFVVGNNNRLAHAAAAAVAERPGHTHNPLFIYGGVGLGKTHLLHAIGHVALDRGLEVVYVSSETFTNEFIESISRGRMEDFRGRYRRTQVLLIDDIQFIAGKEQTQEEFFHTFNAVHEANGQIVISSDRHPRAITTLEDRLRSRFVWGLMADVQSPDLETRTAILRAKAAAVGPVLVPSEVLDFIAAKIPSNIRELEGALNRVLAYAQLSHGPISVDLAAAALSELLQSGGRRSVAPDAVIKAVCKVTGVSREDLGSKHRDRRVVVPRQIAMYVLRQQTELSLSEVGALFGGRDHSTVMHSCEKTAADLERNDHLRSTVRTIHEALAQP